MDTHNRDGRFHRDRLGSFVSRSRDSFHGSCRGSICGRRWGTLCCRRRPFCGVEAHIFIRRIYKSSAGFQRWWTAVSRFPAFFDRIPKIYSCCSGVTSTGMLKTGSAEDVMTAELANQLTASILAYPAMLEKPASACPKIGSTARRDPPYFDTSNI